MIKQTIAVMMLCVSLYAEQFAVDANTLVLWHFNETSGTSASDASGHGDSAVLTGGCAWVSGMFDNGLSLDGVDDKIDLGNYGAPATNATYELWIKWDGPTVTDKQILNVVGVYNLDMRLRNDSIHLDWGTGTKIESKGTFARGAWHYIAVTIDASKVFKLYVDGDLQGTAQSAVTNAWTHVAVGYAHLQNSYFFQGIVDEFRLSNKERTASEISTHWETNSERATLVAHWDFDDGNGTTLTDKSVYGNHGAVSGATWITGINGSALSFDGNNDYVNVPHSESYDVDAHNESYSISVWVKSGQPSLGSLDSRVLEKWHNTMDGYSLAIRAIQGENNCRAMAYDKTNTMSVRFGPIWDDKWHHIVFVVDQACDSIYSYTDGVLNEKLPNTLSASASSPNKDLHIADAGNFGRPYFGLIDDICIYRRALRPIEIQSMYSHYMSPELMNVTAGDGVIPISGIDNDDEVLFTFAGKVYNQIAITAMNINTILPLNNSHSWLSGFGTITSAQWSPDSTRLLITLSTSSGVPTITVGDSVRYTGNGNQVIITGTFSPAALAPQLIAFSYDSTANPRPEFQWHTKASADSYKVAIDDDRNFSSPIVLAYTQDTLFTPSDTLSAGKIYWKVSGSNDTTNFSIVDSLVIIAFTAPSITLPSNSSVITSNDTLVWTESPDPSSTVRYVIMAAGTDDFSADTLISGDTVPDTKICVSELPGYSSIPHNSLVYWKVKAINDWGMETAYSLQRSFLVYFTGVESGVTELVNDASASPNPFNPAVKIQYSFTKDADVVLSIYNIHGKLINVLEKSHCKAGRYVAVWNGTDEKGKNVPSGCYLAKLRAGEYEKTMRLMLLK